MNLCILRYTFKETTHCFLFILTCLCAISINYTLRGVWSYNLVKLDSYSGWKLVSITVLVMYFFSFMFYFIKYKGKENFGLNTKDLVKSTHFFSGMIGIILFNIYFKHKRKVESNIFIFKYFLLHVTFL